MLPTRADDPRTSGHGPSYRAAASVYPLARTGRRRGRNACVLDWTDPTGPALAPGRTGGWTAPPCGSRRWRSATWIATWSRRVGWWRRSIPLCSARPRGWSRSRSRLVPRSGADRRSHGSTARRSRAGSRRSGPPRARSQMASSSNRRDAENAETQSSILGCSSAALRPRRLCDLSSRPSLALWRFNFNAAISARRGGLPRRGSRSPAAT